MSRIRKARTRWQQNRDVLIPVISVIIFIIGGGIALYLAGK